MDRGLSAHAMVCIRSHRVALAVLPALLGAWSGLAPVASAQLTPDQVLVVYDSRIPDSRAVAEYYAGSAKVPGGAGNLPGVRPAVRVLDLSTTAAPATSQGNISYPDFVARLRNPIRTHLSSQNLTRQVRVLVLTKGLPHRILDTTSPFTGDQVGEAPGQFIAELLARDVNCASVDSELTLLWQNLDTSENGGPADSRSDGLIENPYWRATQPITNFTNANILATKSVTAAGGPGPLWTLGPFLTSPVRINPGDIYLVTRLDAPSVPAVRGIIDRAQGLLLNMAQAAIVLDKSSLNFDGITAGSATFGPLIAPGGADYNVTNSIALADGRFRSAPNGPSPNVVFNEQDGAAQFIVGPLLSFSAGIVVSNPVALLVSYGNNHGVVPTVLPGGQSAGSLYASSFNYAPGALFNTMESFNGRDFGGVGGFIGQQQLSDFLAAGGTAGLGNVWEPLADTVPDNVQLLQNFVLGNMTFAEAAWSATPALSWMQIAVGDPLATMARTTEDIDSSGRVTSDDLYRWESTSGPALPRDVNRDGAATIAGDRALLGASLRRAERVNLLLAR